MSRTREGRRERVPFSANMQKLQVDFVDPEFNEKFYARWINDTRGRIHQALNAGYEHVEVEEVVGFSGQGLDSNNDLGTKVSRVVTGPIDGNPEVTAYLMKLRRDWYEEDQQLKSETRKQTERAVFEGRAGGASIDNVYGEITKEIKRTA